MKSKKSQALIVDIIMVMGSILVGVFFIHYFTGQGVELVRYYSHLDPRLTGESLAGLTSAISIAPNGFNLTYMLPKGPSKCNISLWENPTSFFTGMRVGTKEKGRFDDIWGYIDKILTSCEGKSGKEAEDCLKEKKKGSTLAQGLLSLVLGAECPKGPFTELREEFLEWFKNKEINRINVWQALGHLRTGKCTNIIATKYQEKGTKEWVLIQLGFTNTLISAPKYNNVTLHPENKKLDCSKDLQFKLFKANNQIGLKGIV